MTFFSYMSVMVMRMPISSTSPNSSLADAPKYCMLEDNDMYAEGIRRVNIYRFRL